MKFLLTLCFFMTWLPGISWSQNSSPAEMHNSKAGPELTPYQRVSMYMGHSLMKARPIARQSEILWGIKAVKPMLEIAKNLEGDFDAERIEQKIASVLKQKVIPVDAENGQLLLFRIRGVWDRAQVNLLYTYDLDIVDRVYVSRGSQIKSNVRSIWNISNMGFAGKDVFQNAMLINIESAIDRFSISYFEQLDFDIISDTPRLAKQTYENVRDGKNDILELLSGQNLNE